MGKMKKCCRLRKFLSFSWFKDRFKSPTLSCDVIIVYSPCTSYGLADKRAGETEPFPKIELISRFKNAMQPFKHHISLLCTHRGHPLMMFTKKIRFFTPLLPVHMRAGPPLWTSTCGRHEIHSNLVKRPVQ